jgi:hypothetical protein
MPQELNIRVDAGTGEIQAAWRLDGGQLFPIGTDGARMDARPLFEGYPKAAKELAARLAGGICDEKWLREYCISLYTALLPRNVDNALLLCCAQNPQPSIRILADLPPDLHRLPWELMYRPDKFVQPYLCLNSWVSLVRAGVQDNAVPHIIQYPLRILVIVCAPHGLPPLSVRTEIDAMLRALEPLIRSGQVDVEFIQSGDTQLRIQLGNTAHHIWHFIGHAEQIQDQVHLLLEGRSRESMPMSPIDLWGIFPVRRHPILVLLNVCKGAAIGKTATLNSVARAFLSLTGMQAVIGHQFDISDEAASRLTSRFYEYIAAGRGVEQALSMTRTWLARPPADQRSIPAGSAHYWTEWHTPVFFLNGRVGEVLLVAPAPALMPPLAAPKSQLAAQAEAFGNWSEAASYAREALIIDSLAPGICELLQRALLRESIQNAFDEARYAESVGNWGEALRNYSRIIDDPQASPPEIDEARSWAQLAHAGVGVCDPLLRWKD